MSASEGKLWRSKAFSDELMLDEPIGAHRSWEQLGGNIYVSKVYIRYQEGLFTCSCASRP